MGLDLERLDVSALRPVGARVSAPMRALLDSLDFAAFDFEHRIRDGVSTNRPVLPRVLRIFGEECCYHVCERREKRKRIEERREGEKERRREGEKERRREDET